MRLYIARHDICVYLLFKDIRLHVPTFCRNVQMFHLPCSNCAILNIILQLTPHVSMRTQRKWPFQSTNITFGWSHNWYFCRLCSRNAKENVYNGNILYMSIHLSDVYHHCMEALRGMWKFFRHIFLFLQVFLVIVLISATRGWSLFF